MVAVMDEVQADDLVKLEGHRVLFSGSGPEPRNMPVERCKVTTFYKFHRQLPCVVALPICRCGDKVLADGKRMVRDEDGAVRPRGHEGKGTRVGVVLQCDRWHDRTSRMLAPSLRKLREDRVVRMEFLELPEVWMSTSYPRARGVGCKSALVQAAYEMVEARGPHGDLYAGFRGPGIKKGTVGPIHPFIPLAKTEGVVTRVDVEGCVVEVDGVVHYVGDPTGRQASSFREVRDQFDPVPVVVEGEKVYKGQVLFAPFGANPGENPNCEPAEIPVSVFPWVLRRYSRKIGGQRQYPLDMCSGVGSVHLDLTSVPSVQMVRGNPMEVLSGSTPTWDFRLFSTYRYRPVRRK